MQNVMRDEVKNVFNQYPEMAREGLLELRQIIFDVASETEGVGKLVETLKWRQISYLTTITKSGSTIRIDSAKDDAEQVALFFNCKTTLVETFRALYGDVFDFEGNRCVKLNMKNKEQVNAIKHCIALALTYHFNKML